MAVSLVPRTKPDPEVVALVEELEATLAAWYPPEQRHGLRLDALFQPHIRFFVAYRDDRAVGCGGVAMFDDFAEVKRMFVCPEERGTGVADAVMNRLVEETREAGLPVLRLETGIHQHASLRFYARMGFVRCEAFGAYRTMDPHSIATSVFMERPV